MATDTTAQSSGFHEAQRHLAGLTAHAEKRALLWLAPRTPRRVTSDHLTLLGLLAMVACGVLYGLAGRHPWLLLLVNVGLVLNWLGDSLDGTLARYRGVERPRFGFYVDHLVDAFGVLFVLGGLAFSALMSPLVAAGLLVAYYLLSIETYLATYAIGRFKISWGPFGGTELRIVLAVVNALVFVQPRVLRGRVVVARLRRPGRGRDRGPRRPRRRRRGPGHARPRPRRGLGPVAPDAGHPTRGTLRGRSPLVRLSTADSGTAKP